MFEFLVCQVWLAHDLDRNWKLWMQEDRAARDLWRERLRQHARAFHDAADASLTREQREEADVITKVRVEVARDLAGRRPEDRHSFEQRAAQVGLSFLYDGSTDTSPVRRFTRRCSPWICSSRKSQAGSYCAAIPPRSSRRDRSTCRAQNCSTQR
jgi:hypothetical protein